MLRTLAALLFLALVALPEVRCEKAAPQEDMFSGIQNFFEKLNATFQNVTQDVEKAFGVDIPSTQDEVKTAFKKNLDELQANAEKFQKKLAEYNVTGSTFQGLFEQVEQQVNKTISDLAANNPDVKKVVEQVQKSYSGLAQVSKSVGDVVKEQATAASGDLKNLAEQAQVQLAKAASQLQAQVQGALADKQKKSKTA